MTSSGQTYSKLTNRFYINWDHCLGMGSSSSVFAGKQIQTQIPVAIKIFQSMQSTSNCKRQILIMKQLSKLRHPNLMFFYSCQLDSTGKKMYYFLQYCGGGTLKDNISVISESKILRYFQQLLNAVCYLHQLGKVHRDINPDNILISSKQQLESKEQIKLGDFGLTRNIQTMMTRGACTLKYAAPEVINQQVYDQRCDVWSLGAVLYEMLAKKQLFSSRNSEELKLQVKQFISNNKQRFQLPKQVSSNWNQLLKAMLTPVYLKRPQSNKILQLFNQLRPLIEQQLKQKQPEIEFIAKNGQDQKKEKANNIKKYLNFNYQKAQVPLVLQKLLTSNKTYNYLPNLYKYLLRFFGICICVSKKLQILEEIKTRCLGQAMKSILGSSLTLTAAEEQFIEKINQSIIKHKIVLRQVTQKILGDYMKRVNQSSLMNEKHYQSLQAIKRVSEENFDSYRDYSKGFRALCRCKTVFLANEHLSLLKQQDLAVYSWIRVIANLDILFDQHLFAELQVETIFKGIETQIFEQKLDFTRKYNQQYIQKAKSDHNNQAIC